MRRSVGDHAPRTPCNALPHSTNRAALANVLELQPQVARNRQHAQLDNLTCGPCPCRKKREKRQPLILASQVKSSALMNGWQAEQLHTPMTRGMNAELDFQVKMRAATPWALAATAYAKRGEERGEQRWGWEKGRGVGASVQSGGRKHGREGGLKATLS